MSKGKRKAPTTDDFEAQHIQISVPSVKKVHFSSTSASGSHSSSSVIGRLPTQQSLPQSAGQSTALPPPGPPGLEAGGKKQTQNAELLAEFGPLLPKLGSLILEFEADPSIGTLCSCSMGHVTTQCHDCTGYQATCATCFIQNHLNTPFHWAEVWDFEKQYFFRHDIAGLGHIIQLGHNGRPCSAPTPARGFTVVDGNGVHSTKIAFCGCREQPPDKVQQLMRARLFPATTDEPRTAFTFSVLKEFSLHNLESKKAAYDYLGALLRLSDNGFTADIPNPYANFLRVVRLWNYLTLLKRSGQLHGIDLFLPHRPAGNLLVWCPACPEPGFNSDPNCPKTPHHLRHCNQSQRTLDGNFQCNQYNKNTDPDDISLCAGKGYFPPDDEYKAYLAKIPVSREKKWQKSTCNYLKVVNKQNKKKFKNMAITGTVNCQCSHVFILSCVDLQYGERFANTDAALAREVRQRKPGSSLNVILQLEVEDIDKVTTYDIACEYFINLESRFQEHFPDLVHDVRKIRWGVPSLHVQGHQDSCNYLFGTAYMECVGHFHGETAEHYWPEANQLGPHVRQMNNGHRQDTMIMHHGDWNHKKIMKLAATLSNDLALAKARYVEKRDHFISLSISFHHHLSKWQAMDRTATKNGKEAISVYKHRTSKVQVPSQTTIYQAMLAQDDNFQSTLIPRNKLARFLNDALKIQDAQRQLCGATKEAQEHNLESTRKEILGRRTKLGDMIATWRQQQKSLTPKLGDKVSAQAATTPVIAVENETLYLPSDLTALERQELDVAAIGIEEIRWREGQAFDSLRAVQNVVKALTALRDLKHKNERQQKDNSRAGDQIAETTKRRDRHMASYEAARHALISLGALVEGPGTGFPPLTEADLFMKSVRQTRQVGDSRFTDGLLWRTTGHISAPSHIAPSISGAGMSGTQMEKRKSGLLLAPIYLYGDSPRGIIHKANMATEKEISERPEGWLWQLGKMGRLSQAEMEEWSSEGDRVQWFRAEAEMQRWQEQKEQKLVELLRTIRSFAKMEWVWTQLSFQVANKPGHAAYARQKAGMYSRRAEEARTMIRDAGHTELLSPTANVIEFIERERAGEMVYLSSYLHVTEHTE
ncbi:hypothetical protein B0H15DRAFT_925884 [Mycena belliarum]|uniref:CxC2-like cysteine cluster KDZ transposase-associated domain-containing protein n=1 Tax=Mycena belliarum TaxID=1033014 RepID=A0AAD6XI05_9AGAR|nr:hypothetical protein B0H15DRAFT_925884 [Mycena belliae]